MSELYHYPNGATERRYTKNEARLLHSVRIAVVCFCLPFLLALRAISPETEEKLPGPADIRLIGGEFYP